MSGKFIAFEGGEGTGKSTQARLLVEMLGTRGIDAVLSREPGGTPGAEAIREILLNPPGAGWGGRSEALLFAAARSDHVESLIRPTLASGQWVICDRFIDSSRAYQGFAGGLGDATIRDLHAHGSGGLLPHLTIVIDVPQETSRTRLRARDGQSSDAIGGRDSAYHSRVNAAFRDFTQEEPDRFALIDGSGSREEVHERVMAALGPLLKDRA
ncbi:MAG: dTMP kinase, partial [Qipengyuania sp.]